MGTSVSVINFINSSDFGLEMGTSVLEINSGNSFDIVSDFGLPTEFFFLLALTLTFFLLEVFVDGARMSESSSVDWPSSPAPCLSKPEGQT